MKDSNTDYAAMTAEDLTAELGADPQKWLIALQQSVDRCHNRSDAPTWERRYFMGLLRHASDTFAHTMQTQFPHEMPEPAEHPSAKNPAINFAVRFGTDMVPVSL